MEVANTLAYFNTGTIIDVKSFIVQAPVVNQLYLLHLLNISYII